MKKVAKEARLIYAEFGENSNKFYNLWLYEDGTLESENGRVGVTAVRNPLPKLSGERDFEKQLKSKIKKGYTELKTIVSTGAPKTVEVNNLQEIARKQIQTTKPELQKLIDRLVTANIHKITSSSNITYSDITGLFSTPLGVVTPEVITEARTLLAEIKKYVDKKEHGNKALFKVAGQYCRLIPSNVGMKLDTRVLFADDTSIQKQNDILDALLDSYETLQSKPKEGENGQAEEKVFDTELDILEDKAERERLVKKYKETLNRQHVCNNLKIKEIYRIDIRPVSSRFEERGRKYGNIMELFHGSKSSNICSILKSGLIIPPSSASYVCGRLYGDGIYASSQSSKAANYSFGYWSGSREPNCFLFIVDFSMGKVYTPNGYGSRYYGSEKFPAEGYDSTWAKGGVSGVLNDEMIIYKPEQCKIKYLIELGE